MELTLPDGTIRGADGVFSGVPFAAPPVGPLRFQPPQPLLPWDGVLDCTSFPLPPAQLDRASSEDCLYVNVWTHPGAVRAPVLVWLFGGGFERGSGGPPDVDGAAFSTSFEAVIVAVQYRVGALGWLHLDDERTNLGLQDVRAALEWVQRSIAAFGGDPDNVTLGGQSAGAFCVGAMLAEPAGLFHKAILQSGSTGRAIPVSDAQALTEAYREAVGQDLQTAPVEDLLAAQPKVIDTDIGKRNLPGGRIFGVVDTMAAQAAVERGSAKDVPLLITVTQDETQLFAFLAGPSFLPADEQALLEEIGQVFADPQAQLASYQEKGGGLLEQRERFLSEAVYGAPARRLAQAQRAAGGTAFVGTFVNQVNPLLRACHGCELMVFFDSSPLAVLPVLPDSPERRQVRRAWRDFVHTGDPAWGSGVAGILTVEAPD